MKRKYLKKITVSARFKTQVLTQDKFINLTDKESNEVWNSYLKALADTRQISIHQSKTWRYPNKFL